MNLPVVALDARLAGGDSTGDSTYWTGLIYGLAKIEARARILLLSNAERPPNIPETPNIVWQQVSGRNPRWWSFVRFPLAARKLGARAIHSQYSLSPLVGDVGFTTVHDVSFLIGPEWFRARDRFILSRTVPAAIARAKAIFAVSEATKAEIAGFVAGSSSKVVVTYNACPPWISKLDREIAKRVVADRLGITDPYLLTVATRWPRKNVALAIKAAEMLPAEFPHKLVLTGKDGWGDLPRGGRTVRTGYVPNELLSALYSAADLYLLPSRHEGFGIPLLEAFRCECPVLSSSGGALPEIAGGAAAIEHSWNSDDWAVRIATLLSDSSKISKLKAAGVRREAEFTWESTALRTLKTYLGEEL